MDQKIFIKTFGCQMNEYDSNRIYDSVKKFSLWNQKSGKPSLEKPSFAVLLPIIF